MAAVKVSFGNSLRDFKALTKSTNKRVQKEVESAIRITAQEEYVLEAE